MPNVDEEPIVGFGDFLVMEVHRVGIIVDAAVTNSDYADLH